MNDNIIIVATNDTSTQQIKARKDTRAKLEWLLDCAATNPNAINTMHASDMQLWTSSDASYVNVSKARTRVAGFHFLGDAPNDDMSLSEKIHHLTHQCVCK